jgi:hypothetical protein
MSEIRAAPVGPDVSGEVHDGDISVLEPLLQDDSVDLLFTDLQFHDAAQLADIAERFALFAESKLKPGHLCIVYSDLLFFDVIFNALNRYLEYHLLCTIPLRGQQTKTPTRQVLDSDKRVLIFSKGEALHHDYINTRIDGKEDKHFQSWGQHVSECAYLIERVTLPGALVVDPCANTGTILMAAQLMKRRWIGAEQDKGNADNCRNRLNVANLEPLPEDSAIQE